MNIKKFGNANIKTIKVFETENNITLPKDYIEFLLNYNGCDIEPTDDNLVYIEDLNENINVDVLFGLNTDNPELGIELWLNEYGNEMPSEAIIIGTSYQHGFIVLLCAGEDAGVYYWDDTYEFPCSNGEANTYFIADTFTELVKGII
jgi:hypothetical protein